MTLLTIPMMIFCILEISNIIILYTHPGSKIANGIGIFNAWEKSKETPEVHNFIKYLVFWVAGTKLIFIGLIIVIIVTGSRLTQLFGVGTLALTISSFYLKLFPIIRKSDKNNQINPKGYSMVLGIMIGAFILIFAAIFIIEILTTGI